MNNWLSSKPKHGWVYFLKGQDNLFKIGLTTKEPSERVVQFSPKLPFETKLAYKVETDDVYFLERHVHSIFEDKRVNGEWFKLDQEDIDWIETWGGTVYC